MTARRRLLLSTPLRPIPSVAIPGGGGREREEGKEEKEEARERGKGVRGRGGERGKGLEGLRVMLVVGKGYWEGRARLVAPQVVLWWSRGGGEGGRGEEGKEGRASGRDMGERGRGRGLNVHKV